MIKLLSNTPDGPLAGLPLVTVCAAVSAFVHSTVSPELIVSDAGEKHALDVSQPGDAVPFGISTLTVSGPDDSSTGAVGSSIITSSSTTVSSVVVDSASCFTLSAMSANGSACVSGSTVFVITGAETAGVLS